MKILDNEMYFDDSGIKNDGSAVFNWNAGSKKRYLQYNLKISKT
ncbi:MAG: hypothetical protein ACK5MD_08550 [Flavobacteriales bacterium]